VELWDQNPGISGYGKKFEYNPLIGKLLGFSLTDGANTI
jgi:hypothetical protein